MNGLPSVRTQPRAPVGEMRSTAETDALPIHALKVPGRLCVAADSWHFTSAPLTILAPLLAPLPAAMIVARVYSVLVTNTRLAGVNVAVTEREASSVGEQSPKPMQSPD